MIGTKVTIQDGEHYLVIGSVGTIIAQVRDEPPTYIVKGQSTLHHDRIIENELTTDEFNTID